MLEQILSCKFVTKAFAILSAVLNYLHINISELNNVKLLALVLIISALIIFVFLILIIILNNILHLFNHNKSVSSNTSSTASSDSPFTAEEQEELELELQKELEIALAQRNELEQKQKQKRKQQTNDKLSRQAENKTNVIEIDKKENDNNLTPALSTKHYSTDIDFDWQKQKNLVEETFPQIDNSLLSYKQQASKLSSLTGLVIDMFGRDIDEQKIAQTLNYKTKGLSSENDILKFINAIKYFIILCQNNKFAQIGNSSDFPDEKQTLYHLANNDNSLALILLEKLIDKTIDKATNASESKKKQILSETSDHACCLGTLAEPSDLLLSTSIYEMAVELNPNNATAWSRLGDVYRVSNSESKAIWAYQNAYSFADSEINPAELANASQSISGYLYNQGNTLQAAKMHNIAKQYYDSLAINKSFNNQEIEALKIIENNHLQNIPDTINKLLQRER